MGKVIAVTAAYEGAFYSPDKNPDAPMRIYSDRTIQDDYLTRGRRRPKLTKKEYRRVRKAAMENRRRGFV